MVINQYVPLPPVFLPYLKFWPDGITVERLDFERWTETHRPPSQ